MSGKWPKDDSEKIVSGFLRLAEPIFLSPATRPPREPFDVNSRVREQSLWIMSPDNLTRFLDDPETRKFLADPGVAEWAAAFSAKGSPSAKLLAKRLSANPVWDTALIRVSMISPQRTHGAGLVNRLMNFTQRRSGQSLRLHIDRTKMAIGREIRENLSPLLDDLKRQIDKNRSAPEPDQSDRSAAAVLFRARLGELLEERARVEGRIHQLEERLRDIQIEENSIPPAIEVFIPASP